MQLGDAVSAALSKVGVTKDLVERWVGGPCGCAERQEKLNQLGHWLKMVPRLAADRARGFLLGIIGVSDKIVEEPTGANHVSVKGGDAGS